eukprot:bmy_22135T0
MTFHSLHLMFPCPQIPDINACISTPEGSQVLWKIPVATYVTLPPNFPSLGENTTISFIMNATSKASVEKMGFYLPDLGFMGGSAMDPVQMSLQTNPKLCDSGSTLYQLSVYEWSLSIAWGTC